MNTFEFKVLFHHQAASEEILNKLGSLGYQIAAIMPATNDFNTVLIMQRTALEMPDQTALEQMIEDRIETALMECENASAYEQWRASFLPNRLTDEPESMADDSEALIISPQAKTNHLSQ